MAQTLTTLHGFTALNNYTNSDGANPYSELILSGGILYGTAQVGGRSGFGTVFAVDANGPGVSTLHSFSQSDGANPNAGLVSSGNALYGTTFTGGSSGNGTVFKVNTDGTGFTNLHSFTGSNGALPVAGLILSDSTLYGTTFSGGDSGAGTVFKININGTGFTNLYSFTALPSYPGPSTNSDGAAPLAGLVLAGNTLYGTANSGGTGGAGTVFKVNTDGQGFASLHSFAATSGNTNNSGAYPHAGLTLLDETLYGTTFSGGTSGVGAVFKVNTDGTDFDVLHAFSGSDGANPTAGLVLSGNILYGTTFSGGSADRGTVFRIKTDGTRFASLHSFSAFSGPDPINNDGGNPGAGLILSGNCLYGTAGSGGSSGYGTVFSIFASPQLTIAVSEALVVLTWPTNFSDFILQSTTNVFPPMIWTAVSPEPMIIDGQNTVTNLISGPQRFYRLVQ